MRKTSACVPGKPPLLRTAAATHAAVRMILSNQCVQLPLPYPSEGCTERQVLGSATFSLVGGRAVFYAWMRMAVWSERENEGSWRSFELFGTRGLRGLVC